VASQPKADSLMKKDVSESQKNIIFEGIAAE